MSTATKTSFTVNGKTVNVNAAPETPLIFVLRNDLNLKGTRFGCGEGHCGACTIIVDGRATQSCNTPLSFASGKELETVESLTGEPPHPIVAAIESHNAWQCGYCLAGMIMQARALYDSNTSLNRQDLATALNNHFCRCGAHPRILDALVEVFCNKEPSD